MEAHNDQRDCPPDRLAEALEVVSQDDDQGLRHLEDLLRQYPFDARLHFLKGSLLAGVRRYEDAREAMRQAVDIAPSYAIARFQLGFLQLTSGDGEGAEATWGPLEQTHAHDALGLFVRGLRHLIRDEFGQAIDDLTAGIVRNDDNQAMNLDMQLIIDEIRAKQSGAPEAGEPTSSAQILLQQYGAKPTKH